MSYCRVGDQSDVYAFADEDGRFIVQVARNRVPSLSDEQEDAMGARQMLDWLQENARPIGGRCDGEVFCMDTPQQLVDRLRDLLLLGYQVAPDTWVEIDRHHPGVVPLALLPRSPAPRPSVGKPFH